MFNKSCRWLDSNSGPLVSEVTALPTAPQPLPSNRIFLNGLSQKVPMWGTDAFVLDSISVHCVPALANSCGQRFKGPQLSLCQQLHNLFDLLTVSMLLLTVSVLLFTVSMLLLTVSMIQFTVSMTLFTVSMFLFKVSMILFSLDDSIHSLSDSIYGLYDSIHQSKWLNSAGFELIKLGR